MAEPEPAESSEQYKQISEQVTAGIIDFLLKADTGKAVTAWIADVLGKVIGVAVASMAPVGIGLAKGIANSEDLVAPALSEIAAAAVSDTFGVDISASAFATKRDRQGRTDAAAILGAGLYKAIEGGGGAIEPNDEPAKRYLGMVLNMALEGWYQGWFFELMSSLVPYVDIGKIESFAELDDTLSQALGLGRMSRSVMRPLLDATVVTPLQWKVSKQYRPNLLGAGQVAKMVQRNLMPRADGVEELARQGWSNERIDMLLAGEEKELGDSDVEFLLLTNTWSEQTAVQHFVARGYTENDAFTKISVMQYRRIQALDSQFEQAALAAYARGDIAEFDFDRIAQSQFRSPDERRHLRELANLLRELNTKRLSAGRVRQLVKQGILSVVDYRAALRRELWDEFAIRAEELSLRQELEEARALEELRAEQEAERLAEREAAAEAKRQRELELAARDMLPTFTELRKAYVRGLVDRDRFIEALDRERIALTPDDRAILLADADLDRGEQLAREEAAAAAALRKPDPVLPLAQYEQSVLLGILTRDQYVGELVARHYDEAEVNVQVALLDDRIAQKREAEAARDAAAEKARTAGVSLGDFERAVRLGLRTRDAYVALLDQVKTPEVQRALVLDLLDAAIAQDAAARDKRAEQDAAAAAKGLSLAQRRRAVVAGIRPRTYYEAALREAAWPTDDLRVELELLDLELAEADAARRRREAIAAELEVKRLADEAAAAEKARLAQLPPPAPELTLGQIERAVKLGFLEPDVLRRFLTAKGYLGPDVELLVAMVVADIPDVRAGQQLRGQVTGELALKGVSLGELERGVKRGIRTVADYRFALGEAGYRPDAVDLLAQLLEEEVALNLTRMGEQIAATLEATPDAPALDELVDALASEALTAEQFRGLLVMFGVADDTATVYTRLVLSF